MSDTYTKLFSSITASTIVSEPLATRWLWVTMLAMADQNGDVFGSVPGLARIANIELPACEAALDRFKAPDEWSRTKDNEGRRIVEIDGGWRLLNHGKYRAIRDPADRREYMRDHMRAKRARQAAADYSENYSEHGSGQPVSSVSSVSAELAVSTPPTPTPTPTPVKARSRALARSDGKDHRSAPVGSVIGIPTNTGDDFPITADDVREFANLYRSVDVMQELRAMRGWAIGNRAQRKTARGMLRFVNAWLSRAQDRAARMPSGRAQRRMSASERVQAANDAAEAGAEESAIEGDFSDVEE